MSKRFFPAFVAVLLVTIGASSSVTAQDRESLLGELYGRGVHAYFRGQFAEAQQLFDSAVAYRTRDPRCYYFRGLTLLRMGRSSEADHDFRMAATLEYSAEGTYDVGRAIQRIQGHTRLQLEQVRREARLAYLQQSRRRTVQTPAVAPAGPVQQAGGATPLQTIEAPPDASDPFADATTGPIGADVVEKAIPPADSGAQPAPPTDDMGLFDEETAEATARDATETTAADELFPAAPDSPPTTDAAPSTKQPGRQPGVLRSLFRAVVPSGGASRPPATIPDSAAPGAADTPPSAPATDDIFDVPEVDDIFGDSADSGGATNTPPADGAVPDAPVSAPETTDSTGDPFTDDPLDGPSQQ